MNRTCQHCGDLIVGNAYRVTSEEAGVILLDMVVCSLCSAEAKRLHLHTEDVEVGSKQAPDQFRAAHR
jgi:RNase P subunit RPR2